MFTKFAPAEIILFLDVYIFCTQIFVISATKEPFMFTDFAVFVYKFCTQAISSFARKISMFTTFAVLHLLSRIPIENRYPKNPVTTRRHLWLTLPLLQYM